MRTKKINLIEHFKKLIYFNFNRFKDNNYENMREYFAQVFLNDIEQFVLLKNKEVLDVGGANGEFCKFLNKARNCDAVNLEPFPKKTIWKTIKAFADKMPFKSNSFDVILFRGVLEHIPPKKQQHSLNEIYRVMKKEGIGYFIIPPWYNPHAGHGFKPFHVFPFKIAKFLREFFFREKISYNSFEEYSLYKITFNKMQKMIKKSGFEIVNTLDTHFRMHFVTKIPILKELLVPAVAFIVKKPTQNETQN